MSNQSHLQGVNLEKICVNKDLSIEKCVKVLNDGHCRIVLVVDDSQRLLGVVADSDIRRAILNKISLETPISEIMVKNPIVASIGMEDTEILSLMKRTKCYEIPLLDEKHIVVGLQTLDGLIGLEPKAEVIIMAGGLGKRLLPITKNVPKPLVLVGGKPILFILIDKLINAGLKKITLALNYKADAIKDAIAAIPSYTNLVDFIEEEQRLGTAGALSLLKKTPVDPVFVMNADLLTAINFRAMLQFHETNQNQITMAVRTEEYQVPFGVVNLEGTRVVDIVEKPVYSYFANAGIYILQPEILSLVPNNSFYDMPNLIADAIKAGKQVGSFPLHEYWLDIGRPDELQKAQQDFNSIL